ncbi:MAG TPA: ABC transporter permease [Puia sp.]|nr:ABC transporter permease [Puia sp.]
MPTNFLKITFRNLWKNRSYSFLNIFGLAIGVACAGLIFLWVEDELSYDQFFAAKDRTYYIQTNQTYDGKTRTFGSTPTPLAPAITKEIPGIAAACRVQGKQVLFSLDDKGIYESGAYTDTTLFGIFGMKFIEGGIQTDLSSIVISQKMAREFFGGNKALGKTLTLDHKAVYRVAGVVEDFPVNSTLQLSWMIPFQVYYNANGKSRGLDSWGSNNTSTYVELAPGANVAEVNQKLYGFIQTKKEKAVAHAFLFSAKDWHLRDHFEDGKQVGGRIDYVRMFVVIAWIVLLIACINFMNLATARSDKRSKEVGVRKVLGAERRALIRQFIGEAMVLSLMAVILGVILIALVMPAFTLLIDKPLDLRLLEPIHIAALAGITLMCGLVAGSYPALYLSSFNPVSVFKAVRMKGTGAAYIRKGLVVMQFTISVVLIISTVIIYRQIDHILNRDLGYNMKGLLTIDVRGQMVSHFPTIRQDLVRTGVVQDAALNTFNTLSIGNNGDGLKWEGKNSAVDPLVSYRGVTPGFLATVGMQLAAGRDFRQDMAADSLSAVVSETLAHMVSKGSPIGKQIWFDGNSRMTIVGVVKDFIFGDMYGNPEPVIFFCDTGGAKNMYVKLRPGARADEALAKIETVLKQDNPGYPFEYSFVDDDFNALFHSEDLIGKLSRVFAVLAIVISCLGLFGLSAYMAERRVKEIGIRKVLGASVSGLTGLLSREFLRLVILSSLIAFPAAWLIMHHWLQQYAYRIGIEWWIFLAAGGAAVVIALVTVSMQSVRAALMNPTRALRSE